MRLPSRLSLASLLVFAALPTFASLSLGAANHVVISEFGTRGPSAATDEFIELYNPTLSAVDMSGWKLQYKSAGGFTWSDRAILPANTTIQPHGFYLIANNVYVTGAAPDYTSGLWGSGQGMADNGHMQIINASAVTVDKVGWGTGLTDPEGGGSVGAPNHGTSPNGNSVERKAFANSTADSLASGGRHELLGNGQDTDVNSADYVTQTHGRNPQNSSSAREPALTSGGNGTGSAQMVQPTVVFTSHSVDSLKIAFSQDSAYTITTIGIYVPPSWTWSHNTSSVVLSGPAFASATTNIAGDSLYINNAALSTSSGGTVTIAGLTSPSAKGISTFNVLTAVSGGTPAQILSHPKVRVLELVPIVVVHVNNPSDGVSASPYNVGAEATVSGTVTVNYTATNTEIYVQDGTAGIQLFAFGTPPIPIAVGDSLTITGSISQFRGMTELVPDYSLVTVNATGRPSPDPLVINCAGVNATFHADGTEPNEGRLIRINGVTYNSVNSTITDPSGTTNIFIPASYPPTPSVFDIIGILKQFKPGTPAPGPPYKTDYEITPRSPADIISHAGPIFTSSPYEDEIQPTSVKIHWTTNVASTSIVRYGTTPALGDSVVNASPVTTHAVTVPGLTPATVYYYSVGSGDVNGTNFTPNDVFSTASPAQSTGETNVYFNKSVNTSVAFTGNPANGNEDLPARLKTRLDNAKRSIDAAIYNMSGTVGTTIANALIAAKNRGVKVRLIHEYDNSNSTFSSLSSAGIPVINDRFDTINNGLGLMHNKFLSIDSRGGAPESCWVWTGSWNLTDPGTDDDYQNAIEIQDQALAKVYTLEFNEMWGSSTDTPNASSSRFGPRKLDDTPHKFAIGTHLEGDVVVPTTVECYFSPSDNVTSRIIERINAAQRTIGFQLLTLTRGDIASALIARKNAGLSVRGDMDNNTDAGSEYANLVANGVDVHLKTGGGLLHHKYAIFDFDVAPSPWQTFNATTLTGSHNWSSAAENNNNENTVIVPDPGVTNQYLQEFTARYYQFGGTDSVRIVGVEPIGGAIPAALSLSQNYPNPVRARTFVTYALPRREHVMLRLYDVTGREVRTLLDRLQIPGTYRVELDLHALQSGVYFYRLEAGDLRQQRKMLKIR
jgi:phosphatidylserine/phosphatidylglycerophosphate/cardiolipin synthase-like enzyme